MFNETTKIVYLSPHLDDVALSCGGLVWQQTQAGTPVQVWTVCAGDPPAGPFSAYAQAHHARWGTGPEAIVVRREEDVASLAILGARARHLDIPDAIYRRNPVSGAAYVNANEQLFGEVDPAETALIERIAAELLELLPPAAQVVCPLTLGHHIDHQIVRAAAERLGRSLWYYADYPYAVEDAEKIARLVPAGARADVFPVSAAALSAWQASVAAHHSQISTFWPNPETMQIAIKQYSEQVGGVRIWQSLVG